MQPSLHTATIILLILTSIRKCSAFSRSIVPTNHGESSVVVREHMVEMQLRPSLSSTLQGIHFLTWNSYHQPPTTCTVYIIAHVHKRWDRPGSHWHIAKSTTNPFVWAQSRTGRMWCLHTRCWLPSVVNRRDKVLYTKAQSTTMSNLTDMSHCDHTHPHTPIACLG